VRPDKVYRLLGAHWYAGGLYVKDSKPGVQIQADRLYRVEAGDFVYNRLFGWKGSFAVAQEADSGCYVSGEFPCFECDRQRLEPAYLWRYFGRAVVWQEALGLSTGSTPTSRNRLKEEQLVAMAIPLPPLGEQRRIVARIEELAARIEEARGLRRAAADEVGQLAVSAEMRLWPDDCLATAPTLADVTTYLCRGRQSEQGDSRHYLIKTQHVQMGQYVETRLTLAAHVAAKVGTEALARPGDVLIACSAAGCLGRVALYDDAARTASTDTHVAIARPNPELVLPEYLFAYLRGAQGQLQLRSREKGDWQREKVGFRLTELNVADMRHVPVPLPGLPEQQRVVDGLAHLQSRVDGMRRLQAETAAELDALLPSILDRAFRGELA
jgi:type I restriction enzyme S subunit